MQIRVTQPPASLAAALQDSHDRQDCVPVSRRRRHTEQFVNLSEIADRLHVTAVLSEDESAFGSDDP
jgi:hypothetical protein